MQVYDEGYGNLRLGTGQLRGLHHRIFPTNEGRSSAHQNDMRPWRAFWCLYDAKIVAGQLKAPVCSEERSKQQPRSRHGHPKSL
jgi:hypothetical protein